ncbi:MAG: Dabb family protein, partial [Planctomycetota bacterium]|nr:Dabb family protein [Planctomycetota bacterium]
MLHRKYLLLHTLSGLVLAVCVSCSPVQSPSPATSPSPAASAAVQEETIVSEPTSENNPETTESTPSSNETSSTEPSAVEDHSEQVLRHAVFFSFKETASAEDVQGVADAFSQLPSKIDSIIDFQWGVN